jgi:glycosyltransferase involved in cell wall biosynthesis
MKIILANKFFYPRGGDCVHTIAVKNLLEKHGHEVAIFSMSHPENTANEYSSFWPSYIEYGSKVKANIREAILRPFGTNEVRAKWNTLLAGFKPDLVHLQNIHSQLSPVIAEEAYKKGLPVFWTLHDLKLACPAYSMLRDGKPCEVCLADKKNVVKYRCIKNSLPGSLLAYLEALKWNRQTLEKYTTQFISPSEFLKNIMRKAGFSDNKFTRIYNFTEENRFSPVTKKGNYYTYLGRLSSEKGILSLLKAASEIPEYHLKIVGDGPLRSELETEFGKFSHIEFVGHQPPESVNQIVGNARFLVLPSECYENNPLSIIESLALGTPVLGSNLGGIPELIDQGVNGLLFDVSSPGELKNKIQFMMLKTDWSYPAISSVAFNRYNTERYYNELMDCYTKYC